MGALLRIHEAGLIVGRCGPGVNWVTSSVVGLCDKDALERGTFIVRTTKEILSVSVVVRRIGTGKAPFAWAIERTDTEVLIHFSPDRFGSMEAAYRAGRARLADFVPKRLMPPGVTENRLWQSRQVGRDLDERRA